MPFKVIITAAYARRAERFFSRHQDLIEKYGLVLRMLELDPYHPSLHLHPLQGKLKGLHAISLNYQYRITLFLLVRDGEVMPVAIGTHDEVYN